MSIYREVARAVAGGAEINTSCAGQPAMDLIRDTNALAGGANLEPPTTTANLTALHFACQVSNSHRFAKQYVPPFKMNHQELPVIFLRIKIVA